MKLYDEIIRDEFDNITDRYAVLNFKESELEKAQFIMNEIYEITGCKFTDCGMDDEIEFATDWTDRDELKDIKDAYREAKKDWKMR